MAGITDTPAPQGLPRTQGGLMEIENLFRYPALAVGLKPSAIQGKARLRGLYRIISSKTISPHERSLA